MKLGGTAYGSAPVLISGFGRHFWHFLVTKNYLPWGWSWLVTRDSVSSDPPFLSLGVCMKPFSQGHCSSWTSFPVNRTVRPCLPVSRALDHVPWLTWTAQMRIPQSCRCENFRGKSASVMVQWVVQWSVQCELAFDMAKCQAENSHAVFRVTFSHLVAMGIL